MSEREILFRGKRVDNGEWTYGDLLHCDDEAEIYSESVGKNGGYVIPETVGQYTGLTDKNGTRIFEGDIVKQEFSKFRQGTNGICEFHDSSFGLKIKDLGIEKFLPFACICNAIYEVVGNIHNNPELLEGE